MLDARNPPQPSGIAVMERRRLATVKPFVLALKPFILGMCLGFIAGVVVCVVAFVILFLM
jgi:hypothetical protein